MDPPAWGLSPRRRRRSLPDAPAGHAKVLARDGASQQAGQSVDLVRCNVGLFPQSHRAVACPATFSALRDAPAGARPGAAAGAFRSPAGGGGRPAAAPESFGAERLTGWSRQKRNGRRLVKSHRPPKGPM